MTATSTHITIDLWSSASFIGGHPVEQYHWLHEHAPVYWHEEPGGRGFWAVTSATLVKQVSVHPQIFGNRYGMTMYDMPAEQLAHITNLMFLDPPEHTKHRKLVSGEFMPRSAQRWAPIMNELADDIIDGVSEAGECELMTQVVGLLPSYVVAELLGIDRADGVRLYEWTEVMHSAQDSVTDEQRAAANQQVETLAAQLYAAKLKSPDGSLASSLVHAELDGHQLTEHDFGQFVVLLVNAGGDTVRNLVGGGILTLLANPEAKARLENDLDRLMPTAVEEFVRYQSPVVYQRRTALQDTRLGDVDIAEGDKVVLYYGAANRDASVFDDPDTFFVDRDPNPHLGFGGGGPHFCLGAHFARIEIEAMMRRLLTRMPNMELAGEPSWLASNFISGPTSVPLRFTPTARRGPA